MSDENQEETQGRHDEVEQDINGFLSICTWPSPSPPFAMLICPARRRARVGTLNTFPHTSGDMVKPNGRARQAPLPPVLLTSCSLASR
jgi:hypothetical protein